MLSARHARHPGAGLARGMSERLVVDPIKCTAHGMCAELFPEWITLDDWGYPVLRSDDVPPHMRDHAEAAVRSCPAIALRLAKR